ncbi:MAG: amino acid ABC transporter substrate-binding protein [Oligoflexales bacterium]|nr:amino acid ABC transporter substrate-binding protein [Oligoflexales bacterium]
MKTMHAVMLFLFVMTFSGVLSAENYRFSTLEYPPLEYQNTKGKAEGIVVDIVREIMEKRLSHTVEIDVLPWTRALEETRKGNYDAIFTAYITPERKLFLDYSNEILIEQIMALYAKKDRKNKIKFTGDLNELKENNYVIGVQSTISYGQKFDKIRDTLRTERVNSLDQNFVKLAMGKLDLVISNIYVGSQTLNDMDGKNGFKKDDIVQLDTTIERIPSYIGFSKAKNLTALRDIFDAELRKLKQSGEYMNIIKKHNLVIK